MQEYLITLKETTTKTMPIVAPSKSEAIETALLFHLGASDAESNARIKSLTTHVVGSVIGKEANLSEGSMHSYILNLMKILLFHPTKKCFVMDTYNLCCRFCRELAFFPFFNTLIIQRCSLLRWSAKSDSFHLCGCNSLGLTLPYKSPFNLSNIRENLQYNIRNIVLIGHMNKSSGGKNLYRGLGSIDIAAIARSVLMIERDPEDSCIRYMFPVKSSLAYEGCAIRFIFDKQLGFQFLGTSNYKSSSESLPDAGNKTQQAERLLRTFLQEGPQSGKAIIDHIKSTGISEHTIRMTARRIGVKPFRKGTLWYWRLDQVTTLEEQDV